MTGKGESGIKVLLRVRPPDPCRATSRCLTRVDDTKAKYLNMKDSASSTFEFHKVLSESSRQEEAFAAVEEMVDLALDGYDTTVMAYGQTGSGKTHTLLGDVHDAAQQGIIPRAMRRLLEPIEKDAAISSEVTVSMVEIYCERIRDLLNPTGNALTLRDGTGAAQLPEATLVRVRSEAQCMELLARGLLHRSVAATGQHEASSRSHCLVSVH
ncbi:kinesin, partial [Helicosporidium sp. ATCC 50920]